MYKKSAVITCKSAFYQISCADGANFRCFAAQNTLRLASQNTLLPIPYLRLMLYTSHQTRLRGFAVWFRGGIMFTEEKHWDTIYCRCSDPAGILSSGSGCSINPAVCLPVEDKNVRALLFTGNFGLEKESMRITEDGRLAHTPDPFSGSRHVVRDFAENQTEINTGISTTAEGAVAELEKYTEMILAKLKEQPEPEYLWPFSNPPYIENEEDIPIAVYTGAEAGKSEYRKYLAGRYGRYKMTVCGIHVNYSFSDELLEAGFKASGQSDPGSYKNALYLKLARRCAALGWVVTVLTAASPVMDNSYFETGRGGRDTFSGMASVRCSELGYWNHFAAAFDYTSLKDYTDSIQFFVDNRFIAYASELYYPVRLKPPGAFDLDALKEKGADHIELRMVDLNPLVFSGLDVRDLKFIQLLLIYLACAPDEPFSNEAQIQAVQNFKNAAHYDLGIVKIVSSTGIALPADTAALNVLADMKAFFSPLSGDACDILAFEEEKLLHPEKRYASIVREKYSDTFLKKGLELALSNSGPF